MGFITDFANNGVRNKSVFPGTQEGQRQWREIFGENKEDVKKPIGSKIPIPGGSWGRSSVSEPAAFKRLLEAMRSMAPGGWSDDRYAETRNFLSIGYIAIHRIGMQWAQSEFQVFHKDHHHPDGKRPVERWEVTDQRNGPYDLVKLLEKPNNQDSWGKFCYRSCQQKYLTGMALNWMVPNMFGIPVELYTIPTAIAIPQPAVNPDYPDGYYRIQPIYPYGPFSSYPTPSTSVGAPIPAQWMMRTLFPHPLLRYDGFSPQTALRLHLDEVNSIDQSRWYKMQRSINPSAVLNFDEMEASGGLPEDEIERIHSEWQNNFQGPQNAGQLIVGTPGSKLEEWGRAPYEMDYQAGWEQLVSFCLAGFGITKPAAGMIEDSSYSTLFATLKQLHMLTLEPDLNDFAADLTRFLAPFYGDDLIVDIRCKRIDDHDVSNGKVDKLLQLKGQPKAVIAMALKLLDLPVTPGAIEEIAAAGQEQGGGMGGVPGAGNPNDQIAKPNPNKTVEESRKEEEGPTPSEIEKERPKPGNLGRGALGPRMKNMTMQQRIIQSRIKPLNGLFKHASKG